MYIFHAGSLLIFLQDCEYHEICVLKKTTLEKSPTFYALIISANTAVAQVKIADLFYLGWSKVAT